MLFGHAAWVKGFLSGDWAAVDASTRKLLELIRHLGYGSDEMKWRLKLIQLRFDTPNV